MTEEQVMGCSANITATTLSAFRDGELDTTEALNLAAHVRECPACQARLKEYETVIQVLRTQRVPSPLSDVRLRVRRVRQQTSVSAWRLWQQLGAVAAIVLIIAGAAYVAYLRPGAAQPPLHLNWQQVDLPQGVFLSYLHPMAIAANDGNDAYVCSTSLDPSGKHVDDAQDTRPVVWSTRDAGSHWMRAGALPTSAAAITACLLTVDDTHPSTLIAVAVSHSSAANIALTPKQVQTFASFDSGASWRMLADPYAFETEELHSWRGRIYALRCCVPTEHPDSGLYVSTDDMNSWQKVGQPIEAAGQLVQGLWIEPDSGDLLVVSWNPSYDQGYLWSSNDGGIHWSQIASPDLTSFVVQAPEAGHSWHVCGASYSPSFGTVNDAPSRIDRIMCSADGGKSWQPRPTFTSPHSNASSTALQQRTYFWGPALFAITRAGDLLLQDTSGETAALYRLTSTGSAWQSLRDGPADGQAGVRYAAGPGQGMLWTAPYWSNTTQPFSWVDPHGLLYHAMYVTTSGTT